MQELSLLLRSSFLHCVRHFQSVLLDACCLQSDTWSLPFYEVPTSLRTVIGCYGRHTNSPKVAAQKRPEHSKKKKRKVRKRRRRGGSLQRNTPPHTSGASCDDWEGLYIEIICTLCEGEGWNVLRVFRWGHLGCANRGTKGLLISQVANGQEGACIHVPTLPWWVWKGKREKCCKIFYSSFFILNVTFSRNVVAGRSCPTGFLLSSQQKSTQMFFTRQMFSSRRRFCYSVANM